MKFIKSLFSNKLYFQLVLLLVFNIALFIASITFLPLVIYALFYLLITPGYLFLRLINIDKLSFSQLIGYSVGLSIFVIIGLGLFLNTLLPLAGLSQPLTTLSIIMAINILMVTLILLNANSEKSLLKEPLPKFKIYYLFLLTFPLLAFLNSIIMNNNGTLWAGLLLIIAIIITLTLLPKIVKENRDFVYPLTLMSVALSLLLSYSLRSSYISGWDISQEFYVFNLTNEAGLWNISNYLNPYNACLSITILPSIFSAITNLTGEAIFKILYPLIFSVVPVALYGTFRRFMNAYPSFLAALLFCAQWAFISVYPALSREAVALLFFALIISVLASKLDKRNIAILFIIFSFSMVVSHYGTAYIAIILLSGILIVNKIYNLFLKKKNPKSSPEINLRIILLLPLVIFTFMWNSQLTTTGSNIGELVETVAKSIGSSLQDGLLTQSLGVTGLFNTSSEQGAAYAFQELVNNPKNASEQSRIDQNLFGPETTNSYGINIIEDRYPDPVNKNLRYFSVNIALIITFIFGFFGLIGATYSFIRPMRNRVYLTRAVIGGGLVVSIILIPSVASFFGPIRAFQQSLILIAPVIIYGAYLVLAKMKHKDTVIAILVSIFLLVHSTMLQSIVKGPPIFADSFIFTNNSVFYDFYYTKSSEVVSAQWLKSFSPEVLHADEVSNLRLFAYADINNAKTDLVPSSISRNGYVYFTYRNNIKESCTYSSQNLYFLKYSCPNDFLNTEKNLLYSNRESTIYR